MAVVLGFISFALDCRSASSSFCELQNTGVRVPSGWGAELRGVWFSYRFEYCGYQNRQASCRSAKPAADLRSVVVLFHVVYIFLLTTFYR